MGGDAATRLWWGVGSAGWAGPVNQEMLAVSVVRARSLPTLARPSLQRTTSVVQERHQAQAVAQTPPSPRRPRIRSRGRLVVGLA